ncbi:Ger(x)C family spore germination protein [Alteribacter populi]|uniref:Ger(x)C family spore germination protein n=1 Tax=Alteribacter populi TaxID=2011011 RepID=UPI000BBA5826|nr:Ger(x)C family spore germination protein [Alteribacter populi]
MGRKYKYFIFLVTVFLFLTGCWDRNEIEEIGFIIAAAIGSAEEVEKFKKGEDQLALTYQVAIPSLMTGGSEETNAEGTPFFNLKTTERTNFGANRNIPSRQSRLLNYEHLKVILLDDGLIEKGMLKYVLDFFLRDHEMRRNTEVFVVEGDASTVLSDDQPPEPLTGLAIRSTAENDLQDLSMLENVTISEVTNALLNEQSFVVPRVIHREGTSYRVRGGAIFNAQGDFVDWLTDELSIGYKFMNGNMKKGIIEASLDNPEDMFVFEANRMSANISFRLDNEKPIFDVELKSEGALVESWIEDENVIKEQYLREMEEVLETMVVEKTQETIRQMQEEHQLDIFNLLQRVRLQNYSYWEQIRDRWEGPEGEFSTAEVNVTANIRIRHFMTKERFF